MLEKVSGRLTGLRYGAARLARNARAQYLGSQHVADFEDIERFCMFIGYPRSGHSLIGSLLSGHPSCVIAHELDALGHVERGINRTQLFYMLLERDRQFTRMGRAWTGGVYDVDRVWQGCYTRLKVIGDKRGGTSTTHLQRNPKLLEQLRDIVRLPLRVIHVVRNPFDNIATIHRRGDGAPLEESVRFYFSLCETIRGLSENELLASPEICTMRHEAVVADPAAHLARLCEFLELEVFDYFLDTVSQKVRRATNPSRTGLDWPPGMIREVEERLSAFDFLAGYSFESDGLDPKGTR